MTSGGLPSIERFSKRRYLHERRPWTQPSPGDKNADMTYETITVDDRETEVWITLNRPDALNAISATMMAELEGALDAVEDRRTLAALVITGAGRAFCAGVDLKGARARVSGDSPAEANAAFLDRLRLLLLRVEQFPAPVIAAVNGLALAGGLELVLCCDLVVAAQSAKFGDAHANYGLVPGGGSSVRLPRKVGVSRAKQLIYTGDFLPAETLADWGLVNQVVADGNLAAAVTDMAAALASKSPTGLATMKRMVDRGQELGLDEALRHELALNADHAASFDRTEGLAAFAEKRKPRFEGR